MTRLTPLPLLRNLPANLLVVRCGLCDELVLADEACGDITLAPTCPRRSTLEGETPLQLGPVQHPLVTSRMNA